MDISPLVLLFDGLHIEWVTEFTNMLLVHVHFKIIYCFCMLSISHCPSFLTRVTLYIWFWWSENVCVSIVPVAVVPDELFIAWCKNLTLTQCSWVA